MLNTVMSLGNTRRSSRLKPINKTPLKCKIITCILTFTQQKRGGGGGGMGWGMGGGGGVREGGGGGGVAHITTTHGGQRTLYRHIC